MMNLLHWVIAPEAFLPKEFPAEWGSRPQRVILVPPGAFSALYSDVGSEFYKLCGTLPNQEDGWIVDGPITTNFDVVKAHEPLSSREEEGKLLWRWLDEASVCEAWSADVSCYPGGYLALHHERDIALKSTLLPIPEMSACVIRGLVSRWQEIWKEKKRMP